MWYKILFNKGSGAVRITLRPIMRHQLRIKTVRTLYFLNTI